VKKISDFYVDALSEKLDVSINELTDDSRFVEEGDLFIAYKGETSDGRQFIDDAIDRGASAVIAEHGGEWLNSNLYRGVPVVVVKELDAKLNDMVSAFYNSNYDNVNIVGITGTNGKTSCSSYLAQALSKNNAVCCVIGTLGWGQIDALKETHNTTPNNLQLHKMLNGFEKDETDHVIIEASSHGLALGRTENITFNVAVLTNISRDHMDFHGDMEGYIKAKAILFQEESLEFVVVNLDDHYAQFFIEHVSNNVNVITYGSSEQALIHVVNLNSDLQGVTFTIDYEGMLYEFSSRLIGQFNVYNLAAVIGVLLGLGYSMKVIVSMIQDISAVAGRMQLISQKDDDIQVVVDYAHTPDGLEKALENIQVNGINHVWCVFGCGGERDQGKRAIMGKVASEYSDYVVVTNDNPRRESPTSIVADILEGLDTNSTKHDVIMDREEAIKFAIANAKKKSCILIAGKGHETFQDLGVEKVTFSDVDVAQNALENRRRKNA
jgi:UDP-N-acetylmuramoyl-L-alanyl-D-glutamate--2,6-diaminopimelate ligase